MRIKVVNGVPISGLVAPLPPPPGRGEGDLVSRSGGHDRQRSKLAIGQAMAMNNPGQAVEVSIGGSPHSAVPNTTVANTPNNVGGTGGGAGAAAVNASAAVMAAAAASAAAPNQTFRGGSPSVVVHNAPTFTNHNDAASPSPKRHPNGGAVAQSSPAQPLRASLVGGSPTGPTSLPGTPVGAAHAAFGGGGILPPPAAIPSNGLPPSPAAAAAPVTPTAVQIAAAMAQNARVPTMWSLPQVRYLTMGTVFGCGYGSLVLTKIWYMYDPFNLSLIHI